MDDGEDLFENCNVVTLAWVWDWLIQSTRRFLYIHCVLPIPLLSKIHILISHNFFSVFIPFQSSTALQYPGLKKEREERRPTDKLDHLFLFKQIHSVFHLEDK